MIDPPEHLRPIARELAGRLGVHVLFGTQAEAEATAEPRVVLYPHKDHWQFGANTIGVSDGRVPLGYRERWWMMVAGDGYDAARAHLLAALAYLHDRLGGLAFTALSAQVPNVRSLPGVYRGLALVEFKGPIYSARFTTAVLSTTMQVGASADGEAPTEDLPDAVVS